MQIRTDAPREGARSPSTSRSVGASDAAPGDFLSLLGGVLEAGPRERPSSPVESPEDVDASETDAAPVAETGSEDAASAEEVEVDARDGVEARDEAEESSDEEPRRDIESETPELVGGAPPAGDPAVAPVAETVVAPTAVPPSISTKDEVVETGGEVRDAVPAKGPVAPEPVRAPVATDVSTDASVGDDLPADERAPDAIEPSAPASDSDPRPVTSAAANPAARKAATAPNVAGDEASPAASAASTAVEATPTPSPDARAAVAATEATAPRRAGVAEAPVDAADLEVAGEPEASDVDAIDVATESTTETEISGPSEGATAEDHDAALPTPDAAHRPAAARAGDDAPALERAVDPTPTAARPAAASAAPAAARPEGAPATLEIRDLTEQIRLNTRPGVSRIQLVLEPVELGRLVIRLSLKGQHLVGQVSAESAEVLQTLRENLPALRSALAGTGVAVEDFSFEHRDSRPDREAANEIPRTDPGRRRAARIFQATERVGAALPRVRVDASDGLNIWV